MKKFICTLSIFILLFLVFLSFVACNVLNTRYTLNEDQWKEFFANSLSSTRYSISETLTTTYTTSPLVGGSANWVYDSSKFYSYSSQITKYNKNSNITYENYQSYSFVDGKNYHTYTTNISPNSDNLAWKSNYYPCTSEELAQSMFMRDSNYLAKLVCPNNIGYLSEKFFEFKFNNKDNCYIAEFKLEYMTTSYAITFENEKICTINYKQEIKSDDSAIYNGIYEYNITISYD